jgi:hypothetical protein
MLFPGNPSQRLCAATQQQQPDWVGGRDDYTLKNINTVVAFSLSLPGTNAAGERVFSLVNALWTDERIRLEMSIMKSVVPVKHHFRNYMCPEFHEFLVRSRMILEQIHASAECISAPTLPTQVEEVHLTHAAASTSSDSFKGKYQYVHPHKMYRISS